MVNNIPLKKFPYKFRDPNRALDDLRFNTEANWVRRGNKMALSLFHDMSKRVPAYKDFLKKQGVNPTAITSIRDFKNLPTISKENYLRQYPLPSLCWDGEFADQRWTIATTSGSTGEPFYFPHERLQDWQYALVAELYLKTNFDIDKKTTLYVNSFPMGAWIGGVFTYEAITLLSQRGNYKLSIINPGIDKLGVIQAIKKLSPYFEQTILGGYGPFVKDIIDEGTAQGIEWAAYNLKFVFSAESFSEEFRDYVLEAVSAKNFYTSSLNHYGTVDLGTMSYETPISVLLRRMAVNSKNFYSAFFGAHVRLPTLTQFIPELFYFEVDHTRILCSAHSGLPLVRYDLGDNGGTLSYKDTEQRVAKAGFSMDSLAKEAKISNTLWKLPFVYVYERQDFSVSFYAFQIYPETIRRALLQPAVSRYVTSKFIMSVEYTSKMDQRLQIDVELKNRVKEARVIKTLLESAIEQQLLKESSEYLATHKEKGRRVKPHVTLFPYEFEGRFSARIKQKWIKK